MSETNSQPAGLFGLARKLALTGVAALHNRGDLFLVELQEEKTRLIELFIWAAIVSGLGMMFLALFTGTIILLFPSGSRMYAAFGFCAFYFIATTLAFLNLRALWKSDPPAFRDTLSEVEKDSEWLDSSR